FKITPSPAGARISSDHPCPESENKNRIRMEADATVQPNGLLRLTDQKPNTIGTTLYRKAVRLLESHRNASVRSFSTCIVFAINPTSSKEGGYGMGNHVGVNFNTDILYDGNTKLLNITVYLAEMTPSPVRPMISRPVPKLSKIIEEEMYVGFTAATGNGERSSAHYIMGWSFSSGGEHPVAAKLNLSDLLHPPTNTSEKSAYSSKEIGLIVAISAVTLIFIVLLVYFFIYKKRGETLEDWEVNHPHRMRYKELHSATDGFSEERIIGYGGFGTVFRGSLSTSLSDRIAVKKITEGSEQ
ncbi:hypothetical protein HID58_086349, partial [Brassica napus]